MTTQTLNNIARAMVADGKGLLAMDESLGTCNRRFAQAGIPQTLEMRRAYRELLLTTPNLQAYISGVILYDETIHQTRADGMPFVQVARDAGMLVGIKLDGRDGTCGTPWRKGNRGIGRIAGAFAKLR
jgi:fructose-bisphosphate aldolase class I